MPVFNGHDHFDCPSGSGKEKSSVILKVTDRPRTPTSTRRLHTRLIYPEASIGTLVPPVKCELGVPEQRAECMYLCTLSPILMTTLYPKEKVLERNGTPLSSSASWISAARAQPAPRNRVVIIAARFFVSAAQLNRLNQRCQWRAERWDTKGRSPWPYRFRSEVTDSKPLSLILSALKEPGAPVPDPSSSSISLAREDGVFIVRSKVGDVSRQQGGFGFLVGR